MRKFSPFLALFILFILCSSMASGQTISGSILHGDDSPVPGGVVRIYDSDGNDHGTFWTDENGEFVTHPLGNADYYAVTALTYDYVDRVWVAPAGVICVNQACAVTSVGDPIPITDGANAPFTIDFVLEPISGGGHISGNITGLGSPVAGNSAGIQLYNSAGKHLDSVQTDPDGNYITRLLSDDSYYVRTENEPLGLQTEIFEDAPCQWSYECDDSTFITTNGRAIVIPGTDPDPSAIDFVLTPPESGHTISGQIADSLIDPDTGANIPLSGIQVHLLATDGNHLMHTWTDQYGDYYFSGLPNDGYRVYTSGVPEGYEGKFYPDATCIDWGCDHGTTGDVITVADSDMPDKDITLVYSGTRIFGTIKRSDLDEPVSNEFGDMGVDLYNAGDEHIHGTGTDSAGQFQFTNLDPGNYYLSTINGDGFHSLIDEVFDDIPCIDSCDSSTPGAVEVPVTTDNTTFANFALDPGYTISGTISFEGSLTGDGYVHVWSGTGELVTTAWNDGGGGWSTRRLPAGSYYATARGEDWGMVSQLYNQQPCPQEYCDFAPGELIVLTDDNRDGIHFDLQPQDASWTISGTIKNASNEPVGGGIRLVQPNGDTLDHFWTDGDGNWQTWPLADGTYFAVTLNTNGTLDEAWQDVACTNQLCDPTAATPIVVDGGDRANIDFVLSEIPGGGRISGQVRGPGGPLVHVGVSILNRDGDHLMDLTTNEVGYYETPLLNDEVYFVHTIWEPLGLGSELYNNHPCIPYHVCRDPVFVTANGNEVIVDNGDRPNIDFDLVVPDGLGMISGTVTDSDHGAPIPLADVHLTLLNADGHNLGDTHTDKDGDYYFSGLEDGGYKVIADGVPDGYEGELYDNVPCHDWSCNTGSEGAIIDIVSASHEENRDFALSFSGTRIFGRVTRSDTGDPVTSQFGEMTVKLFDADGHHIGDMGTDPAGQYQYVIDADTGYYVSTRNNDGYHKLLDEAWNNHACPHDCNPKDISADLISETSGETFFANFELDPLHSISGFVTAAAGGALENVEVCVTRRDGQWLGCSTTIADGSYAVGGLYPEDDLVVFVNNTNGQPYVLETYVDKPWGDWGAGDGVDISTSSETGIDFVLAEGYFIGGSVHDDDIPANAVEGVDVCIHRTDGSFTGTCGATDDGGTYQTTALPPGTDYVAYVIPEHLGFKREMWDDVPCPANDCDFSLGSPISIGPGPGHATNTNFTLERDTGITGTLRRADNGETLGHGEGRLWRFATDGTAIDSVRTEQDGFYRFSDIGAGDYYLLAGPHDGDLIVEIWNGPVLDGEPCPGLTCNPAALPDAVISVADDTVVDNIDFELDPGSRITGHVRLNGGGVDQAFIYIYDDSGAYLRFGVSDGSGYYQSRSGFPPGTYRAANRRTADGWGDQNLAYVPMAYPNAHCGDPCDVTAGGPIVISGPGDVADIDFDFEEEPKSTISGFILDDQGNPGPGGAVVIWDSQGDYVEHFWVNESGYFETYPLSPDDYFAITQYTGDYIDARWDNVHGEDCQNQLCNPLDGHPILIKDGINATDIIFLLDSIEGGGHISGHLTGLGGPLEKTGVTILNRDGGHLMDLHTDAEGYYQTPLLANDTYYVHTIWEPFGLGSELYNDQPCIPSHLCRDYGFLLANGELVPVENGDTTDIDFDLIIPPGLGLISGQVRDADPLVDIPMPDVQVALLDNDGQQINDTTTDKEGAYYFSGLQNGRYKVVAHGVPHGYTPELFNDVPCPDWSCDTGNDGEEIEIIGASHEENRNFALDFSGTRFIGTVTRSDTGEPVTHDYERMAVIIYDQWGGYVHQTGTNSAGQYSFTFEDPGEYFIATDNDLNFHGLMNEGWDGGDGWKCFSDCDFPNGNAVLVPTGQDQTVVMNFVLDPLPTISGIVTTGGGDRLQDIEVCVTRRDGHWLGCTWTNVDGEYTIKGLYPEDDLVVFVNNTSGQPYLLETYENQSYGDWGAGAAVNISASSAPDIDFALDRGYFISGTVVDPGLNPVEGVDVCIHRSDGSFTDVCGHTDGNGDYQAGTLPAGTDYVAYVIPEHLGYKREMWNDEPCPSNQCDFSAGSPITLGPDHAPDKDFILENDTGITGIMRRSATGETLSNNEGRARLYRADGSRELVDIVNTDDNGFYRFSGLAPGNYYLLATPGNGNLIDELWNGPHDGEHCPRFSCDTTELTEAVIVVTEGSIESGIDVDMDAGSQVSGHLSLQGSDDPVGYGNIYLYNEAGVYAGYGRSDGSGDYTTRSGFPGGHYYVANRLILNGQAYRNEAFVPMVYENAQCGYPCDLSHGTTVGVDGEHDVGGIDFEFIAETEVTISGSILDQYGLPNPGGAVRLLKSNDDWQQDFWVDGEGGFQTDPLPAGVYYAVTSNHDGFVHDRWDDDDGEQCPNLLCDFYGGAPIVIGSGVSATGIDFVLDPTEGGGTISGHVADGSGTPLGGIFIAIFNRDGLYMAGAGTDQDGNYESQTLLDERYYVRTESEPLGLGRELYNDKPCLPVTDCEDPAYITGTGDHVDVAGVEVGGIDFVLEVPETGHTLSGKITDGDIPAELPDIQVHLFSADGQNLAWTQTDRYGDYYFSGLPDGEYRVYASQVPPGYTGTVYPDIPCHEWSCNPGQTGESIPISGAHSQGNDIVLFHTGKRIFGAVTRTDDGQPVSSQFGWVSVNLFNSNGDPIDSTHTDSAGQFAFYPDQDDTYYLTVESDSQFHGLINEGWDNWHCWDDCDSIKDNGNPIPIAGDGTLVRNFELEAAPVIRGVVSGEGGGLLDNINVCVSRKSDNRMVSCDLTDIDGVYQAIGLPSRDDLVVWIQALNGQPYFRQMHDSLPCCNIADGTSVDVTGGDREINFLLAPSASLSGTVLDSSSVTGIGDVTLELLTAQCDVVESTVSGSDGSFTISGFNDPEQVYYLAAYDNNQYYINTLYTQENRYNPCEPDVQDGKPIIVGHLQHKGGLIVAMDPGGSISGTIFDENSVLPGWSGQARLSDESGNIITAAWQKPPTMTYRIGGVIPGSYHLVLSSRFLGLIDERWDDVPCPRNSCPLNLGQSVIVGNVDGEVEHVAGMNATLESGSVIRGRITDIATGEGVPGGYEIFFYTDSGRYAGYSYTDEDGYYESVTGFPEGYYLASNQLRQNDYRPVYLGYLPQVWTEDGSFGDCGEPCEFTLGDRFHVNGADPVEDIDLVLQRGSTVTGTVRNIGASPLANIELRLLNSIDGSLIRSVFTDAAGEYSFEGVGAGSYYLRTLNDNGYVDLLWGGPSGDIPCDPSCIPFEGELVISDGSSPHAAIDFDLQTTPEIQGRVTNSSGDGMAGVRVEAFNTLGVSEDETVTNVMGDYSLINLWSGTFYVRTFNNDGLVDALYAGQYCESDEQACDPTEGTPIPLAAGTLTGINLELGTPARIFGNVSSVDGPISGVTLLLFRADGAEVSRTMTDGSGAYSLDGLKGDNYHLVTRNNFGFIDEGAGGETCQDCPPTSTKLISVATSTEREQNFLLELGGAIEGTVFSAEGVATLPDVTVAAFNSGGDEISSAVTGPYGTYRLTGLVGDSVYLRTFNAGNYRNQSYDQLPCDSSCEVLEGTVIDAVPGVLIDGKDFRLESGYSISGHVTDTSIPAAGIGKITVVAYAGEQAVASDETVAGGAFEIDGLPPGDYRLRTTSSTKYIDRVLGGENCSPEPCDINSGSVIPITDTDVVVPNIQVDTGTPIIVTVTDLGGIRLPTGTAWLYSTTGQLLTSAEVLDGSCTFPNNAYGRYFMLVSNRSGLVDQLYDRVDWPCDGCDMVTDGTPIFIDPPVTLALTADGAATSTGSPQATDPPRIRFQLSTGYHISGSVQAMGQPVTFTKVYIFNEDGTIAGEGTTDGLGKFESDSAFPDGNYYAATSRATRPEDTPEEATDAEDGVGGGLVDQVWNGFACDGICGPPFLPGDSTVIQIQGADRTDIHFDLFQAPGIDLQMLTNGVDADTPNGGKAPVIPPGETVNWIYRVTNVGGVQLGSLDVNDDKGIDVVCPLSTLEPEASMDCTASAPAEDLSSDPFTGVIGNCAGIPSSRLYQNTGAVTAETAGGTRVEAEDISHYCNPLKDLIFKSGFE